MRTREQTTAPVIGRGDALVVEGTLAGCVVAHTLAAEGRRVALAASGCSLPFEIAVCRRPWATDEQIARLPEPFARAFGESVAGVAADGSRLLNLAKLALAVEDILLDAGARILYGMTPCGVARHSTGSLSAAVFGGKFGLGAIEAGCFFDCSPPAVLASLAGAAPNLRAKGGSVLVRVSAKAGAATEEAPVVMDRGQRNVAPTRWPEEAFLPCDAPELAEGGVTLRGPYAEFALRLPIKPGPFGMARLSNLARDAMRRIGVQLSEERARLGRPQIYFHRFSGGLLTEPLHRIRGAGTGEPNRVKGLGNVWVCGPAADLSDSKAERLADPFAAVGAAKRLAANVLSRGAAPSSAPGPSERAASTRAATEDSRPPPTFRFADAAPLHADGAIRLGELNPPTLAECDVLVAGAGTSGVPAALAAARSGARTILVEQHADVGGVRTVGGVGSYWYGRQTPWLTECDGDLDSLISASGMSEEIAMLKLLRDAGVTVLTNCPVVGVALDCDRVAGAVAATGRGLGVLRGRVVVDATGDADLAAWAGAPFEYGNGRDAWTQWASFANFNEEKRTASRQYDSAIEIRDPVDFARAVVTGRRCQGMWRRFAHEMPQHYVAPRETRRINGRARVTYGGILAGETFADTMIVCQSNFDIKGIASSDLICCGVVWSWETRTNYLAAIPYGALLPKGVEGLLVAGRAYSVSHDALALVRMQRDMAALGAAAGIAAARAAKANCSPSELDVSGLQEEWVRRGVLRGEDLRRFGKPPGQYTAERAERDAADLAAGRGHWQGQLARLMSCPAAVGPLRRALANAKTPAAKAKIARALCYLGDASGVAFLLERIARQTAKGLPRGHRKTLRPPPEHGWAAEPAYSLCALGFAGRAVDAAGLMRAVAEKIEDNAERFASNRDSQFEYVKTICHVAEREPGPAMRPALDALADKACLRGHALPFDGDLRLAGDPLRERLAYLELCVGRALARCADRRGYDILLAYLDDARGFLARSAEDELRDLVGEPKTRTRAGWARRAGRLKALKPVPYTGRID